MAAVDPDSPQAFAAQVRNTLLNAHKTMRWRHLFGVALAATLLSFGCSLSKPESHAGKLLDPNGNFTLYVSNQSYAITPVDIEVRIDGDTVIRSDFDVSTQHNWKTFKLTLSPGKHELRVTSSKGEAKLVQEFEVKGIHWAVIDYWFYPESHTHPTPRQFSFDIENEPIYFE